MLKYAQLPAGKILSLYEGVHAHLTLIILIEVSITCCAVCFWHIVDCAVCTFSMLYVLFLRMYLFPLSRTRIFILLPMPFEVVLYLFSVVCTFPYTYDYHFLIALTASGMSTVDDVNSWAWLHFTLYGCLQRAPSFGSHNLNAIPPIELYIFVYIYVYTPFLLFPHNRGMLRRSRCALIFL